MLDNLINLVREQAGDSIINNPAVPNEKNEEVIAEAGSSITGGLQNILSSTGGLQNILKLFGGQDQAHGDNPVVQSLSGNVIQQLMNKFGLDQQSASGIAGGLVPNVLQKLVSKTNDPNDNSFDLQGIFNHLSGGKTQTVNVQGLLGKFTGGSLDKDGDGDTDLQDVMAMFSGGGQGGGLLDAVKGFFDR